MQYIKLKHRSIAMPENWNELTLTQLFTLAVYGMRKLTAHHLIRKVIATSTRHELDGLRGSFHRVFHRDSLHIDIGHHIRSVEVEHQDLATLEQHVFLVVFNSDILFL